MTSPQTRPLSLLAELTYRCPLQCPYCSNPLELGKYRQELDTDTWKRVFREAASLGVVQLHLSGGELNTAAKPQASAPEGEADAAAGV